MERLEGLLRQAKGVAPKNRPRADALLQEAHMLARELAEQHRVDVTVPRTLNALMRWTAHQKGWWKE